MLLNEFVENTAPRLFSVNGDHRRLPDSITNTDLVKVLDSNGRGQSVYVLPEWYVIVDRASRRLHVVDPPIYRRLAAAALIRRWRQTLLKPRRDDAGRSNRDVVESTTAAGVQLSQLMTP